MHAVDERKIDRGPAGNLPEERAVVAEVPPRVSAAAEESERIAAGEEPIAGRPREHHVGPDLGPNLEPRVDADRRDTRQLQAQPGADADLEVVPRSEARVQAGKEFVALHQLDGTRRSGPCCSALTGQGEDRFALTVRAATVARAAGERQPSAG